MASGKNKQERDQGEYQTWTRRNGNAIGNDRYGRSLDEKRVDNVTVTTTQTPKEKINGNH